MNNKFNAIIIDDERPARLMISSLLKKHDNTINLIGEAKNGKEALKLIEELKPDLIFLDIQMPDMNGFEVLAGDTNTVNRESRVIFIPKGGRKNCFFPM
jgi:two-component system LytT family response regulator